MSIGAAQVKVVRVYNEAGKRMLFFVRKHAPVNSKVAVTFVSLIVLVMSNVAAPGVHAILNSDLKAINLGEPVFYGGELGISSSGGGSGGGAGGCYSLDASPVDNPNELAEAINEYVAGKAPANSPLRGLGEEFVTGSQRADINPFFLVAIAQKESSFGTAGVATNGSRNSFGRTATEDQPHVETYQESTDKWRLWYKYDSFAASLDGEGEEDQPTYMRRVFVEDKGLSTVEDVMNVYAPSSENDTDMYVEQMNGWIDEMVDKAGDSVACSGSWVWPFSNGAGSGTITSCFGARQSPGGIGSTNHPGVDIAAGGNGHVLAAAAGEVVSAGMAGGAGNMVVIKHQDGHMEEGETVTRYMHNSSIHVQVGETVEPGHHIANEGATGAVTGPHLHFEIKVNGVATDPLLELSIPSGISITGSNCTIPSPGGSS